jgi:AraC family transcriptional regulator, regulatory protein of adaptative response / DNA-3-methyladenine glycosylase II
VESIEGDCYRRTIQIDSQVGELEVRPAPEGSLLRVRVILPTYDRLMLVVERVRRIFDLAADPLRVADHLTRDPQLGQMLGWRPGLRVPGVWDVFELAVGVVLGQQFTDADSRRTLSRLVQTFGKRIKSSSRKLTHLFPAPEDLVHANLVAIGIPVARAETLQALARAGCEGKLPLTRYRSLDNLISLLCELPGIDQGVAHYVAMRAFGEPDAFPSGDSRFGGVLAAGGRSLSEDELESRTQTWRPWRAYAAMHLWAAEQIRPAESRRRRTRDA